MFISNAKELSKILSAEPDLNNYYATDNFVIHPILLSVFKCVDSFFKDDSKKIMAYYEKLYSHESYPHKNYTKLCIFVGIVPYLVKRQQLTAYLDNGLWDLFFENPKAITPIIKIDKYMETLTNHAACFNDKINKDMLGYILVDITSAKCRFSINNEVVWSLVDLMLRKITFYNWNVLIYQLCSSLLLELRSGSALSLNGRSTLTIFLKLASVCHFSMLRYSKNIHIQLSSALLKISIHCKQDSNDFQMVGYAFMNSLLSLYSSNDDIVYFQLLLESKKFFIYQPSNNRLKYLIMIKIIALLRVELIKGKIPIEFLHICYVVCFGEIFQPKDGLKTIKDLLVSYKYGYLLEMRMKNRAMCIRLANRPYWIDVVVEIIVSLLVQPSRWSKKICFNAFKALISNRFQGSTWKILFKCISEPETLLFVDKAYSSTSKLEPSSKNSSTHPFSIIKHTTDDDLILDEATPQQLAELEKLTHLIRSGNPLKQTKTNPVVGLYRAFQQRILGMLECAEKLRLSKIQAINCSKDMVKYLVNFKTASSKVEDGNFTNKLLSTIRVFTQIKHFDAPNKKHSCRINLKLVNFAAKHFVDYSYKMKKNPEFLSIWFKWLHMVSSHLFESIRTAPTPHDHCYQLADEAFATLQMEIFDDFLKKRNPLMKKEHIIGLVRSSNFTEKVLNSFVIRMCDCLCNSKLRGPQMVTVTYVLLVALKVALGSRKPSPNHSLLISKCEQVIKVSSSFTKHGKVKTNICNLEKLIRKLKRNDFNSI